MGLSNDERGWVMTGLSGLACIFGASFIGIDIIVRQFPGQQHFRIQDSDVFLSVSLSLSFGVMLFSAIYSMLPSSKSSLRDGGFSASEATWIMIACFIGGAGGIQIISQLFHHFIPHDIVGCEHTHETEEHPKEDVESQSHAGHGTDSHKHDPHPAHSDHHQHHQHEPRQPQMQAAHPARAAGSRFWEFRRSTQGKQPTDTSHLHQPDPPTRPVHDGRTASAHDTARPLASIESSSDFERPSLPSRVTASITQLATGRDPSCESDGPCFGYSSVCEDHCFRKAGIPGTTHQQPHASATESTPLLQHQHVHNEPSHSLPRPSSSSGSLLGSQHHSEPASPREHAHSHFHEHENDLTASQNHHHHVPQNAFLSIGLQTSLAIALHKLPEGFITYATNHANPKLGVSVFLALFIHNITEGFALALPLYLATNSRLRAMLISFVLGGLSQPLGAGIAALWFALATGGNGGDGGDGAGDGSPGRLPTPSNAAYGAMFAVTAGILANVALQLFSEALERTHSRTLCLASAFVGMGILGVSSALTA